jgi:hypothetical protein
VIIQKSYLLGVNKISISFFNYNSLPFSLSPSFHAFPEQSLCSSIQMARSINRKLVMITLQKN